MKHTPRNLASVNKSPAPVRALPSAASTLTSSYTVSPKIGLATLMLAAFSLTGCTQEKTSSASSPEVSQSASVSSSSSSPSDQATSSPTPTSTPSPSESISYSGGSKAPAGEYRPADEFGPAQNVPRPVEPEGMNVESVEGMLAFIEYWNEWRNYANQTGDISMVKPLVDDSFELEHNFYTALDEIYNSGGWVIGGKRTIHYNTNLLFSEGNGLYSIGANFELENSVLWYDNEAQAYDNSQHIYRGVQLKVQFKDNSWQVLSAKEVK